MKKPSVLFVILLLFGLSARSNAEEVDRKDLALTTSGDLPTGEKHISVVSNPADRSFILILSADPTPNKLSWIRFGCTTREFPEAYWQALVPYDPKPAITTPRTLSIAIVPKNQALNRITLIVGCRRPPNIA